MGKYAELAALLECAAKALREVDAALAAITPVGRALPQLAGYEQLSVRVRTALRREGVETVEALCGLSEDDLCLLRNFGRTSLTEVREFLAGHGLHLRGDGLGVREGCTG